MVNRLKSAFGNPFNWFAFILLAILLRGILWAYLGHLAHVHLSGDEIIENYFVKDDYLYFFHPVDNYFSTGHYTYLTGVPFTGRMPGYAIVYFFARLIFSQQIALWVVILLQFLLSAISVYVLSLIAYYLFDNNKRAFYITYALYVLAVFPGFFDFFIIAESFSVSALIFSLCFLIKYFKIEPKQKYLVISGLFLAWAIFLREYIGVLIVVMPLVLAYHLLFVKKETLKKTIMHLVLFCLLFGIFETAWVARNYAIKKQIILLESPIDEAYGKLYSKSWLALDNLVFTWGENASPFDKNSLGYYYRYPKAASTIKFPPRIFKGVTTYNADSLVKLRQLYDIYFNGTDTTGHAKLNVYIASRCEVYKQDYISHNVFSYWIIKPLKDLRYFVIFSGTGYLPMPPFSKCIFKEKLLKSVFCILYFLILIAGLIGLLLNSLKKSSARFLSVLVLLISLTITFSVIFYSEIQEPRYFVHVFALLVPFAAFTIDKIMPKGNAFRA